MLDYLLTTLRKYIIVFAVVVRDSDKGDNRSILDLLSQVVNKVVRLPVVKLPYYII